MSNKLRELIKCGILFLIGGCLYYCIEILWRGHSHWTMAVVGDWWAEQLYSLGNAALETGWYWSTFCDRHGTCGRHPAEFDAWPAYLGLLFPAV